MPSQHSRYSQMAISAICTKHPVRVPVLAGAGDGDSYDLYVLTDIHLHRQAGALLRRRRTLHGEAADHKQRETEVLPVFC